MSEIQTPELQTLVSSNFRHAYVSENQTFGLDNRQRLYFNTIFTNMLQRVLKPIFIHISKVFRSQNNHKIGHRPDLVELQASTWIDTWSNVGNRWIFNFSNFHTSEKKSEM